MPIDHHDPRPPYRQVADALRASIQRGDLPPGSQLPSGRELAEAWGITHITAARAIKALKDEGLVDVRTGRGTFVRQPRPLVHVSLNYLTGGASWSSEAAAQGMSGSQQFLSVGIEVAWQEVAALLGTSGVVVRRRLMLIEEEPAQLANTYYPKEIAEGTELARPQPMQGGTIAALGRLGFSPTHFHEDWYFRMPTPHEVQLLALAGGIPVARMLRVSYAGERAVSVDEAIMSGDRHVLSHDFNA